MLVFVCECDHGVGVATETRRGHQISPEAGVIGGCESPDRGVGN